MNSGFSSSLNNENDIEIYEVRSFLKRNIRRRQRKERKRKRERGG